MEVGKAMEQKPVSSDEVIVSIAGVEESATELHQSAKHRVQISEPKSSSSSPERIHFSTTPHRPPKIPDEAVARRRSLARSAYSKPKSRFYEPHSYSDESHLVEESSHLVHSSSPYRTSPHTASPNNTTNVRTAPVTPRTPLMASPGGEEDDDEDVYKTENIKVGGESGNKMKVTALIEWIVFLCIMGVLVASLIVEELKNHTIWSLEIWKWCVLVLVIFCGRLFTGWFINVLVFLIESNFLLRKKVLYFVYGLKKSVRVFIWLCLILLAWGLLISRGVRRPRRTTRILNYITRALASALIGAGMWMVKTLFVKILASSFHVNRFFDRIQESIFHQYVLKTLSGPPIASIEYASRFGSDISSGRLSFKNLKKGKKVEKEEVIDIEKLHKMKQEKISAWTMRGLINVIQGSGLHTNTLGDCGDDEGVGQKDKEITSELEAKAAAYRIFKNVARHGHKYIEEDDLLLFMKKEEVDNVLSMFEGATETRKIKKSSLMKWVVNVYNERKSLAHSLNDTKTAIEELNRILSGIVLVLIFIVWYLLMGFATTQVLVFISSQLLLVVFIFGNTCKTVFEAIIFVFVMHPFDVGDRCVIDGVQMVVEEMNILTTIFLRYDNEKISYPNSVLAIKPISNFYRSPEMGDSVEFAIGLSTPAHSIVDLKSKIKAYLESKPQYWRPNHTVQVKDIEDLNKMKLALYVTHTINFQNYSDKTSRKTELMLELKKIFEELRIKYNLLPQEVHLINTGSPAPGLTNSLH